MTKATLAEIVQRHPGAIHFGIRWWCTPIFGWAMIVFNIAVKVGLFTTIFILLAEARFQLSDLNDFTSYALIIISLFVLFFFGRLFFAVDDLLLIFARKFFTQSTINRALRSQCFVLFLREFASDNTLVQTGVSLNDVTDELQGDLRTAKGDPEQLVINLIMTTLVFIRRKLIGWTPEASLYSVLPRCAELIAVGRPGDIISRGASNRLYVKDVSWQEVVKDMIVSADIVVFRYSGTLSPGLKWESDQLTEQSVRAKVIFLTIDSAGRPLPQVKLDQIGVNSLGSAVLEPVYGYWFPDGVSPVAIAARPKWHRSARRNFESALYDILRKQPSLRAINGWAPTRRSDAQWFVLQWIVPVVISAALAFTHSNWIAVMNTAVPLLGLLCVAVPVAYYVLGTLGAYAGLALLDAPSEEA